MDAEKHTYQDDTYPRYLRRTIAEMRKIIESSTTDDYPHDEVSAAQTLAPRDLMWWLMERYKRYRYPGERVVSPRVFRAQNGGDCDNWTVYLCGLFSAIGKRCHAGLKYEGRWPFRRSYYHAFAILDDGKNMIKLDPWNPRDINPYSGSRQEA